MILIALDKKAHPNTFYVFAVQVDLKKVILQPVARLGLVSYESLQPTTPVKKVLPVTKQRIL